MSPNLTTDLARSHTQDLQAYAAHARLVRLATRCCDSAPVRLTRDALHALRAVPARTLHWLRAGQLQAPCSC